MSLLNSDYTRAMRFLMSKKSSFPKQTQLDFNEKKIRFADSDINHTANISEAGGIYDLLRSTNDKEVGISDFDSNKLETGVNVAVDKIKLGYGKAPAADKKTAAAINFTSLRSALPVELLSAKLIIKQDGKVLAKLPVERFTTGANSQKVQGEEDALLLGTPIVLIEQKPIDLQLEFGPNTNMNAGTDDHFLQVRLMGTETSSK